MEGDRQGKRTDILEELVFPYLVALHETDADYRGRELQTEQALIPSFKELI